MNNNDRGCCAAPLEDGSCCGLPDRHDGEHYSTKEMMKDLVNPSRHEVVRLTTERDTALARAKRAETLLERAEVAFHAAIARAQAAEAACAEMRAALEKVAPAAADGTRAWDHVTALLSRTDLGAGKVLVARDVVERVGSVAESMRASYAVRPDENPIEEVLDVRRLLDAIDALLDDKKGGG